MKSQHLASLVTSALLAALVLQAGCNSSGGDVPQPTETSDTATGSATGAASNPSATGENDQAPAADDQTVAQAHDADTVAAEDARTAPQNNSPSDPAGDPAAEDAFDLERSP